MADSLLATDASFPEWTRPGMRFDGIRNTLRWSFDVMVELGPGDSFAATPALDLVTKLWGAPLLTLFPPPTPPTAYRMYFPPFPFPLPEAG